MSDFEVKITHEAEKDIQKLSPVLKDKFFDILSEVIAKNPFQGKKLIGDLRESYSYKLSFKDRIVYKIDVKHRIIYIQRARTHYGD